MDGSSPARSDSTRIADGLNELCRWAATVTWADVPEAIRWRAAMVLSDDLAAMIAAG